MKFICRCFLVIILIQTTPSLVVFAADRFHTGASATADKPQSKAWYHDGHWWCILGDGVEGSFFYKRVDGGWEKGAFPDALVYPKKQTRADVLSKGNTLFVLEWEATEPHVYKYTYDVNQKTYRLLTGFPVHLNVPGGHETMVIEQDSKGKLWITFELNGKVKVLYSTSKDHLSWNTKGVEIADGLKDDDIAAIVAFNGQIGVFWSNQNTESLYFRIHRDGTPDDKWQTPETVVSGGSVADDHINLAVSGDGRVFSVSKTSVDDVKGKPVERPTEAQFILNVRSPEGTWKLYDVAKLSLAVKTRPIVVLDEESQNAHVFYREGKDIVVQTSSMTNINFDVPPVAILKKAGVTFDNVTSTKQNVTSETGLLILSSGDDTNTHSRFIPLAKKRQ